MPKVFKYSSLLDSIQIPVDIEIKVNGKKSTILAGEWLIVDKNELYAVSDKDYSDDFVTLLDRKLKLEGRPPVRMGNTNAKKPNLGKVRVL